MVSQQTFRFLTEYYAEAMRKAYTETYAKQMDSRRYDNLQGFGRGAFKAWVQNMLWDLLDRVMFRAKEKYILADSAMRNIYIYNGRYTERIDNPKAFMKELIRQIFLELEIGLSYMGCTEKISSELLSTLSVSSEFLFRPSSRYIAFDNGIFDLKTGELKPPNPRFLTNIVLDFDYKSESECNQLFRPVCKRWDDFVAGVFENASVRKDVQTFCGALMLDRHDIKFEYLAVIYGPGANGKSVFVDAITAVFGSEYYATFTPEQLFKQGANSGFCVADLEGKLVNVVGDLDNKDFSGGSLKKYVSGEKIMAREVYGRKNRPVEPPLMICCTNEMPESRDDSEGHHRRILPFESTRKMWTEKERDVRLTAKLTTTEARQYIFNWIYKGHRRLVNAKDNDALWSEITERAKQRFEDNANSMRRWWKDSEWEVAEKGEEGAFWKPLKDLYEEYKSYNERCGYDKQRRDYEVSRMIVSKGGIKDRKEGGMAFLVKRKNNANGQ